MRAYRANLRRYQSTSLAAECDWQQAVSDAVEKAWASGFLYQIQTAKCFQGGLQASHVAHDSLAARLLKSRADVPVLGVVNVPMLGVHASSCIKDIVSALATDLQPFRPPPCTSSFRQTKLSMGLVGWESLRGTPRLLRIKPCGRTSLGQVEWFASRKHRASFLQRRA